MQEISVKVYEFDGPAVRRFPFRIPAEGNTYAGIYSTLLEKVKEICAVENSNIEIIWKDEEGDVIVISSDDEVKEALRHRNGDMFRIFVRSAAIGGRSESVASSVRIIEDTMTTAAAPMEDDSSSPPPPATEPKEKQGPTPTTNGVHSGVICDGCNKEEIEGARYKCLVCRDYDLCAACNEKHVHDEHPMIRIATPADRSWWPAFAASQGINNPRGFFHRGRGHGHGHGHWRGHGGRGRCPFFAGPERADGEQQQQNTTTTTNGSNNSCGAQQQQQQQQQPMPEIPAFPFMRDIGQAVAAVLNGFGIDVDIDVEQGGQRTKVATPKNQAEKQAENQPQQTQEPKSTTPVSTDQTMENIASPPAEAAANGQQQEWMILDATDAGGVKETPAGATASAPAPPPTSTDPRVLAGLNYMLAMGFTNEGGWLTQLLEAKGGDISAVLEILHPEEKRG